MEELKGKLLEMFKWFHEFCKEHQLRYYAIGGTMLGAVRHQGFIPWDDDIDVGMPRDDYERLEDEMKKLSGGKYVLETPNSSKRDFLYPFSKIYDTSTTVVEHTKYRIKRGVYIDVFPLDGIGNSYDECKANYFCVKKQYDFLLARVSGVRKGRSLYKNLAVVALRLIPNFLLNDKKIQMKLVDMCKKYKFSDCEWCGNLVGAWGMREIMPKEIFGEPVLYSFETIKIYGAADADGYLSHVYGDWRRLPPEKKQVTHHDFVMCDLYRSYLS